MAADEIATVYFLDVGQGTSQVIAFADGSLVIIDCGASADALVMLLKTISFSRIRAVVFSHWHDDHVNGTPAVIANFGFRIDAFHLPQDQPAVDIKANLIYRQIVKLKDKRKNTLVLDRLEFRNSDHGRIYGATSSSDGPVLSVLYPDYEQSIEAQSQGDSNQGSGVLILEYGKGRILFPGDAGKKAFKALIQRLGNGPITCNILAAPHHSGKLNKGAIDVRGYRNCYHWLYQDVVQPDYVIVSAGTDNTYDHPKRDHLLEAVSVGATVVCTQMTPQCHTDVKSVKPSLLPLIHHPAECGLNSGVGCGGTIVAVLNSAGVKIERLGEHQRKVNALATSQSPLCRSSLSTSSVV